MLFKEEDLVNASFIVNESNSGETIFCNHIVSITPDVDRGNNLNIKITFKINILFKNGVNDGVMAETDFYKIVNIELIGKKEPTDFNSLNHILLGMTLEIKEFLLKNIAYKTIQILPPLILDSDITMVLEHVFSELKETSL